jgi:hypothetical protein
MDVDVAEVVSTTVVGRLVTVVSADGPEQAAGRTRIARSNDRRMSQTRLRAVRMEAGTISARPPDSERRGSG